MSKISCIAVFDRPDLNLRGNIAAVVFLEKPLDGPEMQRLAEDINQPATTFLWPDGAGSYGVRWFAPDAEIGLCGHGTLAAVAAVGKSIVMHAGNHELSGNTINSDHARMKLSAIAANEEVEPPVGLEESLGKPIKGFFRTNNKHIVLLENESAVVGMRPDFVALRKIDVFGYSVTAPGDSCDFVSRTLVPHVKQLEDHATGSSHAALAPFWSDRLNKKELTGIQRSPRGGYFSCEVDGDSVYLEGHFTVIFEGQLQT